VRGAGRRRLMFRRTSVSGSQDPRKYDPNARRQRRRCDAEGGRAPTSTARGRRFSCLLRQLAQARKFGDRCHPEISKYVRRLRQTTLQRTRVHTAYIPEYHEGSAIITKLLPSSSSANSHDLRRPAVRNRSSRGGSARCCGMGLGGKLAAFLASIASNPRATIGQLRC